MKIKGFALVLFLFLFIAAALSAEDYPAAPDFKLVSAQGKEVALESLRGKIVFIDFWASWCPPCKASIPAVERLYGALDGKEVAVLGINIENKPEAVKRFVLEKGFSYPVLSGNSRIASEYGVSGIPAFFIINGEGNIVKKYAGYYPGMEEEWEAEIKELLRTVKGGKSKSKK
ncbi:MAG: TlpA family protein disulfide reductase [Endomicrobiales bacterium]|nr:TlpA family protein disulfide reductase [Endomicrobiales bacterium]